MSDIDLMLPDPALSAPYPIGLALDLALETAPLADILETYNLDKEAFLKIWGNPVFKREYDEHREAMKTEGWSFRKKAAMQAELYLHKIYNLIAQDTTPANVKSDLIKATVRWAGYDTPPQAGGQKDAFDPGKIADMVKSLPDGELELRVAQIVFKRTPPTGITYDAE